MTVSTRTWAPPFDAVMAGGALNQKAPQLSAEPKNEIGPATKRGAEKKKGPARCLSCGADR